MSIIHGRNVILSINGTAFASAKSCELNVQADTIETSSPSNGTYKTHIPGRMSWSVSLSHLVLNIKANKNMVGTTVSISMYPSGTGSLSTDVISGTAIVKQWRITGTVGNLAQGSFQLVGTGALT